MRAHTLAGVVVAFVAASAPGTAQTDPSNVFERGFAMPVAPLPTSASTIDCILNLTESISMLRETERLRFRASVSFDARREGSGLSVTFTGLGTNHPMLVGNAGSSELLELQTSAMVRTLVETNENDFPFIYNIDYESGMIIATKAYVHPFGGYGHVAAGGCSVRR